MKSYPQKEKNDFIIVKKWDENGDDVNLIAKSLYNHFQGIHQLVPQFSNAFVNTENNLQCEHS